jgi:hypothetical protein
VRVRVSVRVRVRVNIVLVVPYKQMSISSTGLDGTTTYLFGTI